ncbi:MAG: hypothetical protein IT378_01065 [Sandaracinaceae bacterium]|nr:hypothetical protein [Sandaracinaceae bacterium]
MSIAHYGRQLAAEVDVDDASSVARFLAAVAPLDMHRAQARRSEGQPAPEPEPVIDPSEPVPPVA